SSAIVSNTKMLTREEIMALARNEYARQLSNYTKAQLLKNKSKENHQSRAKHLVPPKNQKVQ
ncbi:unnamed protein product, partial [Rhizopus stolonifer]